MKTKHVLRGGFGLLVLLAACESTLNPQPLPPVNADEGSAMDGGTSPPPFTGDVPGDAGPAEQEAGSDAGSDAGDAATDADAG